MATPQATPTPTYNMEALTPQVYRLAHSHTTDELLAILLCCDRAAAAAVKAPAISTSDAEPTPPAGWTQLIWETYEKPNGADHAEWIKHGGADFDNKVQVGSGKQSAFIPKGNLNYIEYPTPVLPTQFASDIESVFEGMVYFDGYAKDAFAWLHHIGMAVNFMYPLWGMDATGHAMAGSNGMGVDALGGTPSVDVMPLHKWFWVRLLSTNVLATIEFVDSQSSQPPTWLNSGPKFASAPDILGVQKAGAVMSIGKFAEDMWVDNCRIIERDRPVVAPAIVAPVMVGTPPFNQFPPPPVPAGYKQIVWETWDRPVGADNNGPRQWEKKGSADFDTTTPAGLGQGIQIGTATTAGYHDKIIWNEFDGQPHSYVFEALVRMEKHPAQGPSRNLFHLYGDRQVYVQLNETDSKIFGHTQVPNKPTPEAADSIPYDTWFWIRFEMISSAQITVEFSLANGPYPPVWLGSGSKFTKLPPASPGSDDRPIIATSFEIGSSAGVFFIDNCRLLQTDP
jgi:hypothetical protein